MVCMSARATTRIVDKIVEDYNVNVLYWADDLKDNLQVFNLNTVFNSVLIVSFLMYSSVTAMVLLTHSMNMLKTVI